MGMRWEPAFDPLTTAPASWPPVITRVYTGSPASVAAQMQAEAPTFQQQGYTITSQNYIAGSWGCGAFAIAIALILVVGLGLLILAYLLIVKPAGTLTVVYQRVAPAAPAQASSPAFQHFPTG